MAEELDVAVGQIEIVQGVTGETVDQGYTAGSQTMRTQWATSLRIAAASARQALLRRAGVHGEQGPETIDVILRKHAGHDLVHLDQLARAVRDD